MNTSSHSSSTITSSTRNPFLSAAVSKEDLCFPRKRKSWLRLRLVVVEANDRVVIEGEVDTESMDEGDEGGVS